MSAFADWAYHSAHSPTVEDKFGFTERDISKLRDDMKAAAYEAVREKWNTSAVAKEASRFFSPPSWIELSDRLSDLMTDVALGDIFQGLEDFGTEDGDHD